MHKASEASLHVIFSVGSKVGGNTQAVCAFASGCSKGKCIHESIILLLLSYCLVDSMKLCKRLLRIR